MSVLVPAPVPEERRGSLLRRVRTRLSIHAHRKVRGMLDGEYTSVFHGRSLEFDDLRPYVPGDEVKDIDWKATARLDSLMTRRYVASRKQTIVLVVDTGRSMAATAHSGESKRDLAVLAAGTMGYIATRHSDLVALVAGDAEHTRFVRAQSTEAHLERLLQDIHDHTTLDAPPSDLTSQLAFVGKAFSSGRILVVIADDRVLSTTEREQVRRLAVQHEILWITIADADLMGEGLVMRGMSDVESAVSLPSFVRENPALRAEFEESVARAATDSQDMFDGLAISSQRVTSEADVVPGLFRLLELHKSGRGRTGRGRDGRR
jgi:uncharacterized protein (DUF58 family)